MTKIKIGLFGFGVVGQGIYEVVRKSKNAHAEIVKICVRDPKKPRKIEVDPSLFTTSVDDILDNQNINLVVEVIDDADAALINKLESDPYFNGDETQRLFQKAILQLPEKQRIIFNLKYFQEMKYEDMSEILGTSVGALKASYHHAVKKVEEYLTKDV